MLTNQILNLILTFTLIFYHDDLRSILNDHHVEVLITSLTEACKIKIVQFENIVHILVAYPKVKFICKKITIFPVSHNHVTLQIQDETIAECNDDILAVSECVRTPYASVGKLIEIIVNGAYLITYRFSANINDKKYVNQCEIVDRTPGIAGHLYSVSSVMTRY